jgi:hypothetical protein
MSDRQRHRAFAFSAVLTVAVCALVWLVERPHPGSPAEAERTSRAPSPLVLGARPHESSAGKGGTAARSRSPREGQGTGPVLAGGAQIEATARRFTDAFVRYEVGRLPAAVRRTIQSTATLSLATSLISAPPRIPNGARPPAPAQVWSVDLPERPKEGQAAVAVELRTAAGEISTLTEVLSRSGQGWRVSSLG